MLTATLAREAELLHNPKAVSLQRAGAGGPPRIYALSYAPGALDTDMQVRAGSGGGGKGGGLWVRAWDVHAVRGHHGVSHGQVDCCSVATHYLKLALYELTVELISRPSIACPLLIVGSHPWVLVDSRGIGMMATVGDSDSHGVGV
jgi:hypothetical protein